MNDRLLIFIKYVAGKQTAFAEMMGWDKQYLSKLVRGVGLGITPILSILEKFPDLNARWLLLGSGAMLHSLSAEARPEVASARRFLTQAVSLARFFPVMTEDELAEYAAGRTEFTPATLARWSELLVAMQSPKIDDIEMSLSPAGGDGVCPF